MFFSALVTKMGNSCRSTSCVGEALAHLVFGEFALVEVEGHEPFVVLGNRLDERVVERVGLLAERGVDLLRLERAAAVFGKVELLHQQHVDDGARALPARDLHDGGAAPEAVLDLRHEVR